VADLVGNVSPLSAGLTVTFDSAAPAAAVINLATASDTGALNNDRVTNDITPTFFGTTEPFATVTLTMYDSTVTDLILGTVKADANGYWELTAPPMNAPTASPIKDVGSQVTDVAGNSTTGPQQGLRLVIDTVIPVVTSILAVPGSDSGVTSDFITNVTAPSLTGIVTFNTDDIYMGAGVPGFVVTLYEGANVLGTSAVTNTGGAGTVANGHWTINSPTLSEGTHTLTVKVVDPAGNVSLPLSQQVVIDTVVLPPSVPDLLPVYDSGTSNTDNVTTVSSLSFSGTSEPGAAIKLYDNGTYNVPTTADSAGNWTIPLTTALSLGLHAITVTQTDKAGNVSVASAPLMVTIATVPPNPSTPDLVDASDTGSSNSDNRTNDTTPTLSGTAEAGSTVVLFDGATNVGTTVADQAGNWTITSTTLSQATHLLTVKASNAIGTSPPSLALSVIIDTTGTAPGTPDLAATSDNGISTTDNITNITTPVITGTGEAGASVTLFDGATARGSTTVAANGAWSITTTPLSEGVHTLSAVATDTAGNVSAPSATLTVTIDSTTPTASSAPDLVDSSDKGASNTDNLTNASSVNLTGLAEAGARVTLYANGTAQPVITANAAGVWASGYTAGTSGVVNFSASVSDTSGNVAPMSETLAVTFDLTKPLVPVVNLATASDWGLSNSDRFTSDPTPTFYGTTEPFATITLTCLSQEPIPFHDPFNRTLVLGTVTADANGYWELTSPSLAGFSTVSSKYISCQITDVAGNVTTQTGTSGALFGIDTTKPTATSILFATGSDSGVVGDVTTNVTAPVFTGVVTLNTDDLWSSNSIPGTVMLYDGATLVGTAALTGNFTSGTVVNTRYTVASATLTEGTHNLTLKAVDVAGNESLPLAQTVIIDTTALPPSIPDMVPGSDNGVSSTDNITAAKSQTYTGVGEPGGTVKLYDGGTLLTGTGTIDGAGNWTLSVNVGTVGVHAITAVQTDKAGNVSAPSAALQVTIGNVPTIPSAPDLDAASDNGASNTDNKTNDTTPTLSGTADPDSTITLFEGAVTLGTTTASATGAWSITSTPLSQATHVLTAKAASVLGTSGLSTALSVVIDTATAVPGALDLTAASDDGSSTTDNITSVTTPTISGNAEGFSSIVLYEGAFVWGSATATSAGLWSITSSPMGTGTHSLTAIATDVAGNVSSPSNALLVTIVSAGTPHAPLPKPGANSSAIDGGTPIELIGSQHIGDPGMVLFG
jgi:hypothetical protein